MRRLNIRFLAGLIVGVVVLGAVAYGLHEFQVRRTARHLLTRADRAERKGDSTEAESYLRQYLAYAPDDVDALVKYGQVIEKNAKSPEERRRALTTFTQVIQRDRSRRDVRRRIVDLAMDPSLKGVVDPRPHLEGLLRASPKDGELEYLLARCEEDAGQIDKATTHYKKAIADSPKRIDAYIRLTALLRTRTKDAAGADKVMAALIAANGDSGQAYRARADYRVAWKLDGAEKDLARARELAPDDAEVLLSSARLEMSGDRPDPDRVRGYLARAAARNPRDANIHESAFVLEVRSDHPREAEAKLRDGIKALEGRDDFDSIRGRIKLNWGLAEFLIDRHQLVEAEQVVDELRRDKVRAEPTEFLEARISAAKGDWAGAIRKLEALTPKLSAPSSSDLATKSFLLLGACYELAGRPDQQYSAYRRAVNLEPANLRARVGLAKALMEMGRVDEAIDEFRQIVAKEPRVAIVLARLLIRRNLPLPAAQRDWDEARQALGRAELATPDAIELPLSRAEILLAENNPDEARKLLRGACERHPKRVEPWIALANLAMRQKAPGQVLPILDEAAGRLGDRVELRLARAQYLASRDDPSGRKALDALAEGSDRFDDKERQLLLHGLADAHLRLGDTEAATRLMRRLADERKDDLRSRLVLFDLALKSDEAEAIDRAVREIRKSEGDEGVLWQYARARQLIREAKPGDKATMAGLKEARARLAAVAALRPGWSAVAVSEGEIDDLSGDQDGAIRNYLRAILELGERGVTPIQRTVQLLYDRRRYREADSVLRKLPDSEGGLGTEELQRLAALVSLRTGSNERAVGLARKAVAADPKDYRNQVLLGQAMSVSGNRGEAEASLRRATDLAPDRPETWLALVEFLAATDGPKAEAAIREAEGKLPKDQADVALARCYSRIGQVSRAGERLEAARKARPEDPAVLRELVEVHLRMNKLGEAKDDLRRIIALGAIAPEDKKPAARLLASLLAAGGNQREMREALAVLGIDATQAARPVAGESSEDSRAKARVLAMQSSRARRQDAIKILVGLSEREPPTAEDHDMLAQLYERDGNWAKARDQILSVIAPSEADLASPPYLARYARRFLDHDDVPGAAACVEKLKKLEPASLRTVEVEARLKKAQNRPAEALALLRDYSKAHDAEAGRVASILEDLGQADAAEELLRHAADRATGPEPHFAMAGFLARRGRAGEALDACERAGKFCPAEQVADAFVAVLNATKADAEHARRVERWIQEVLRRDPKSVIPTFNLANLRVAEGRYREAEALFRKCIEMSPESSGPMNNLAWLLAFEGPRGPEALGWIDRAITNGGPTPDLLDTRAVVLMKIGRNAEAIKDLEDASVAAPKNASVFFHLAEAQVLSKNTRAASEAFKRAKALDLKVAGLHPAERKSYQDLETLIARR